MRIPTILAAVCLLLFSCQQEEGCTYPDALNYDPTAEIDDGSCEYDVEGCTDPEAVNYNPEATVDDGSCEYDVEGCTDPEAVNYNPEATVDDGSCDYLGCTDPEAFNYDEQATLDDGSCEYIEDVQPTFDNHTYEIVVIGEQIWFAENLRTTVYANGESIFGSDIVNDDDWASATSGIVTVYGEGESNCYNYCPDIDACDEAQSIQSFGRLYNWYAVNDERGLCPNDWHIPSEEEWTELQTFVSAQGFEGNEGSALKATTGWADSGNGTDNFGFSALPGGWRHHWSGAFNVAGRYGHFWSTAWDGNEAGKVVFHYNLTALTFDQSIPQGGGSVRCIKD